jgi:hypothetical protein
MLTAPFIDSKDAWITPSVFIAILALLFTIASFWWIQVRRGRIVIYPPSTYTGSFTLDKLVLILPLVLYNTGPAPLVVLGLRMTINHKMRDGSPAESALPTTIYRHATPSRLYNPEDGKGSRAYASPFAVEGRKAVERFVEFQWNSAGTTLEHGPYDVIVEVQTAHRRGWRRAMAFQLHTDHAYYSALDLRPGFAPMIDVHLCGGGVA